MRLLMAGEAGKVGTVKAIKIFFFFLSCYVEKFFVCLFVLLLLLLSFETESYSVTQAGVQ